MIENIKEKKEEVRKIWLEHRDKMSTSELYKKFLHPYFDTANWTIHHKDWFFFLIWIRGWKREMKKKEDEERIATKLRGLTDEEAEAAQKKNRKKMIVILSDLIENYEDAENPIKKAFGIGEIRRMYQSIQSLEEKMKTTEIARGKLKLDTVRTLLPYKRMGSEELLTLREKINESLDRILKLKGGEPVGQLGSDSR